MDISVIALGISERIRKFPMLHKTARRAYCTIRPGIKFQIEETFRREKEIFVLKIGANDGVESDPIADYLLHDIRYRGILVEPIPHYARLLSENYQGTGRFKIEQVAISAVAGTFKMYHIAENASEIVGTPVPEWLRGVASLSREHVLGHVAPNMHDIVSESAVECVTVKMLIERNDVKCLNLLQIDAEGYDWIVLQQFDFARFRPKVVLYERKHLSESDQKASREKMESAGYNVKALETDFLCLLRG